MSDECTGPARHPSPPSLAFRERRDSLRRLFALRHVGHQRYPHAAASRIDAVGFARNVAAGKDRDVPRFEQPARKPLVVLHSGPEIETCVRRFDFQHGAEDRQYLCELLSIQRTVLDDRSDVGAAGHRTEGSD